MKLRVAFLQQARGEDPGAAASWAAARGHDLRGVHPYAGEPFPAVDAFDLLIVLGGAMNVCDTDRFPWLLAEKRFLREVIDSGRPALGICLGSQLLAEALGAAVLRNPEPEIGWFPVQRTGAQSPALAGFPDRAEVFQWHEHTWELPPGAVHLASSEACASQAFAYQDRVVGVQFHPEITPEIARFFADADDDLAAGRWVQSAAEMLADTARFERANLLLWGILDQLAGLAAGRRVEASASDTP